jgi:Arc/MetJ-type ribon-helix-helix transcriptional regulator
VKGVESTDSNWEPGMKNPRRARRTSRQASSVSRSEPLREALLATLEQRADKGKPGRKLQAIADALVDLAMKGDLYAIREIFDRVDGPVSRMAENESKTKR